MVLSALKPATVTLWRSGTLVAPPAIGRVSSGIPLPSLSCTDNAVTPARRTDATAPKSHVTVSRNFPPGDFEKAGGPLTGCDLPSKSMSSKPCGLIVGFTNSSKVKAHLVPLCATFTRSGAAVTPACWLTFWSFTEHSGFLMPVPPVTAP